MGNRNTSTNTYPAIANSNAPGRLPGQSYSDYRAQVTVWQAKQRAEQQRKREQQQAAANAATRQQLNSQNFSASYARPSTPTLLTPEQAAEQKRQEENRQYDLKLAKELEAAKKTVADARAREAQQNAQAALQPSLTDQIQGTSIVSTGLSAPTPTVAAVEPGHGADVPVIAIPSTDEIITNSNNATAAYDARVAEEIHTAVETTDALSAERYKTMHQPQDTQTLADGSYGLRQTLKVMAQHENTIGNMASEIGGSFQFPQKSTTAAIASVQDPATIVVLDVNNRIKFQTNKFLLMGMSKSYQERFQVTETFGEPSVMFFNDRAQMYTLSGTLLDADYMNATKQITQGATEATKKTQQSIYEKKQARYQWAQAFQAFYQNYLRGTKLKENNFKAAIYVNNTIIKGYPLQLTLNKDSGGMADTVSFQMTWVIENDTLLKSKLVEYMYDGGKTLSDEVNIAFGNFQAAVDTYNELKSMYEYARFLAETEDLKKKLDVASKEITTTEQILLKLLATKKNVFYEVDN